MFICRVSWFVRIAIFRIHLLSPVTQSLLALGEKLCPSLPKLLNAYLLLTLCVRMHHNPTAGEGRFATLVWEGDWDSICQLLQPLPVPSLRNNTSQQKEKNTIEESKCWLRKGTPLAISYSILPCQP